jgi:hypothetical protein
MNACARSRRVQLLYLNGSDLSSWVPVRHVSRASNNTLKAVQCDPIKLPERQWLDGFSGPQNTRGSVHCSCRHGGVRTSEDHSGPGPGRCKLPPVALTRWRIRFDNNHRAAVTYIMSIFTHYYVFASCCMTGELSCIQGDSVLLDTTVFPQDFCCHCTCQALKQ